MLLGALRGRLPRAAAAQRPLVAAAQLRSPARAGAMGLSTSTSAAATAVDVILSPEEANNLVRDAETGGRPVFVDASWSLDPFRNMRDEFVEAHLPDARYFDLEEVSDPNSSLPHMMPSAEDFAEAMDSMGICNADHVIVYTGPGCISAPRVWWMFKAFGHERASLLQGGKYAWHENGLPFHRGLPPSGSSSGGGDGGPYRATLRPELVRDASQVLNIVNGQEKAMLVDARSAARFDGSAEEPRPGVRSGHMPGAVNLPFVHLLKPDMETYITDTDELRAIFMRHGITPGETPIVTTCGSGVTACYITVALHLLGEPLERASVYDGSWSEWGTQEELPVEV